MLSRGVDLAASGELTGENRERLCFSVPEAARMLGISRGLAYELARSGQLPALRLGKRLLVPKVALERLLSEASSSAGGNN
jgi:excisionase family DNA binding protein